MLLGEKNLRIFTPESFQLKTNNESEYKLENP